MRESDGSDGRYPRFYRTDRWQGREHIVCDDDDSASASKIGGGSQCWVVVVGTMRQRQRRRRGKCGDRPWGCCGTSTQAPHVSLFLFADEPLPLEEVAQDPFSKVHSTSIAAINLGPKIEKKNSALRTSSGPITAGSIRSGGSPSPSSSAYSSVSKACSSRCTLNTPTAVSMED